MKYVKIPEDISLGTDQLGKPVVHPFVAWLNANPLNGKAFGANGDGLRTSVKLALRFEDAKVGEVIPLSDEEWAMLKSGSETPLGEGFNTQVAKMLLPYMDTIRDAPEEDPSKEDKKAKKAK